MHDSCKQDVCPNQVLCCRRKDIIFDRGMRAIFTEGSCLIDCLMLTKHVGKHEKVNVTVERLTKRNSTKWIIKHTAPDNDLGIGSHVWCNSQDRNQASYIPRRTTGASPVQYDELALPAILDFCRNQCYIFLSGGMGTTVTNEEIVLRASVVKNVQPNGGSCFIFLACNVCCVCVCVCVSLSESEGSFTAHHCRHRIW